MAAKQPIQAGTGAGTTVLFGTPKTIYLISPQAWDELKVSKHHYARELADLGHRVFFIEPPASLPQATVAETETPGVFRVAYRTWFPYRLKFRARALFDIAMKRQAILLRKLIGSPPDIVWDFDNSYQFASLRAFGAPLNILHLVDQPMRGRTGCKGAHFVFAVGQAYLDALQIREARVQVVPHGLGATYACYARRIEAGDFPATPRKARPRAAFVGNLESLAFDAETVLRQVLANPGVDFELIGPFSEGRAKDPADPIGRLANAANVTMTGRLESESIIERARGIDIWLISYDRRKTPDGSVNPHKILEYMATGSSILSSRLDTLTNCSLMHMAPTTSNDTLPMMLADLANRIEEINTPDLKRRRAGYALKFTYHNNLQEIDRLISGASV